MSLVGVMFLQTEQQLKFTLNMYYHALAVSQHFSV